MPLFVAEVKTQGCTLRLLLDEPDLSQAWRVAEATVPLIEDVVSLDVQRLALSSASASARQSKADDIRELRELHQNTSARPRSSCTGKASSAGPSSTSTTRRCSAHVDKPRT